MFCSLFPAFDARLRFTDFLFSLLSSDRRSSDEIDAHYCCGSTTRQTKQDVVVGDICVLEPGEIIPVDGIFLRGHNVRCDESGATGESDAVRKAPFEECWAEHEAFLAGEGEETKKDPFLISGSKVLEGVGAYVVVAVGERSFNGRIMMGALSFSLVGKVF